jgi:hypothetical protein
MRRGFGFLGLVLTGILLAIVGVVSYDAGWSAGAATHVVEGTAGAVAPYYYYGGPHFFGFGFFGFFFLLFILFISFGLFRALRFGRGWGYGGWGRGYGMKGGHGGGVPPAIEERMQQWHKRAHGEAPPTPAPSPPPDQTQV